MPAALAPAIMAHAFGRGQVHDVRPRAGARAAAEITFSMARRSATGGRDATNEP